MALLQLDNVTKEFEGLTAVERCCIEVTPGSVYGLIGPNGAGKTTLFNLISGLDRPTSGRVFFSDKDIPSGHLQQFVAIDRFTGGSSEGALYKVHAAPPCVVRGRISWRTAPDPDGDWRLALLAMLARDAMEGDLIVGWGKARGYGQGVAGLRLPAQPAGSDSDLDWPTLATWLGEGRQLDPHLRTFRAIFQPTAEEACHD